MSDLPFKATGPDLHERLFADLPSLDEIERRYLLHVIEQVGATEPVPRRCSASIALSLIDGRAIQHRSQEDIPGSGAT